MKYLYGAIIAVCLTGLSAQAQETDKNTDIAWHDNMHPFAPIFLVPGGWLAGSGITDFVVDRMHPEYYGRACKKVAVGFALLAVGLKLINKGKASA